MDKRKIKPKSVAVLRTDSEAKCAFCKSNFHDEVKFGKIYTLGTITCHYFCVLLSSCVQKGKDNQGLLGFLKLDLINEIARGKKLRCSYCRLYGATLACDALNCKQQFHLSCGKERGSISLFYGNYQTFCPNHAPKQKLPTELQAKVKARIRLKAKRNKNKTVTKKINYDDTNDLDTKTSKRQICSICYEYVENFPSVDTLWPPCCGGDLWFHRNCVERMALSAARHFLKCPLCNDKTTFCSTVMNQGVYVPDRDASWELEQEAYLELTNINGFCSAKVCLCHHGRNHDEEDACWKIILCASCGNVKQGCHIQCLDESSKQLDLPMFRCADCLALDVVVPLETIERALKNEAETANLTTSNRNRRLHRIEMPTRFSIRTRLITSAHTLRQGRSGEATLSNSLNSSKISEQGLFLKKTNENVSNINTNDETSNLTTSNKNRRLHRSEMPTRFSIRTRLRQGRSGEATLSNSLNSSKISEQGIFLKKTDENVSNNTNDEVCSVEIQSKKRNVKRQKL